MAGTGTMAVRDPTDVDERIRGTDEDGLQKVTAPNGLAHET